MLDVIFKKGRRYLELYDCIVVSHCSNSCHMDNFKGVARKFSRRCFGIFFLKYPSKLKKISIEFLVLGVKTSLGQLYVMIENWEIGLCWKLNQHLRKREGCLTTGPQRSTCHTCRFVYIWLDTLTTLQREMDL